MKDPERKKSHEEVIRLSDKKDTSGQLESHEEIIRLSDKKDTSGQLESHEEIIRLFDKKERVEQLEPIEDSNTLSKKNKIIPSGEPVPFKEAAYDGYMDPENLWEDENESTYFIKIILRVSLVLLVILVVAAWIVNQFYFSSAEDGPETKVEGQDKVNMDLSHIVVSPYLESVSGEEAIQSVKEAVQGYMESASAEERSHHILGEKIHLPQLLEYEARPETSIPRGLKEITKIIPYAMASIPYWSVWARDFDDRFFEFIVVPGENKMVIDWACSVGYGTLSHEEFLSSKPTEPVFMRVVLRYDPLRNVDGLENYFIASDFRRNHEYALYFNDQFPSLRMVLKQVRRTKKHSLSQLRIFWNTERNMAEVSEVSHLNWFDRELMAQVAPAPVNDRKKKKDKSPEE